MDVDRSIFKPLHDSTELLEIILGRVLKIDRDVDVFHAEAADAGRLVRQRLFVSVEAEIYDVADSESPNFSELFLGRLTGRSDPVIESRPIVKCLRGQPSGFPFWVFGRRSPAGNTADRGR
jgi:hypothetical protein